LLFWGRPVEQHLRETKAMSDLVLAQEPLIRLIAFAEI
jgi:hypothetical protein